MKLTPLHDWVLIRTGEPSARSAGGIIIPDSAQERPEDEKSSLWGPVA